MIVIFLLLLFKYGACSCNPPCGTSSCRICNCTTNTKCVNVRSDYLIPDPYDPAEKYWLYCFVASTNKKELDYDGIFKVEVKKLSNPYETQEYNYYETQEWKVYCDSSLSEKCSHTESEILSRSHGENQVFNLGEGENHNNMKGSVFMYGYVRANNYACDKWRTSCKSTNQGQDHYCESMENAELLHCYSLTEKFVRGAGSVLDTSYEKKFLNCTKYLEDQLSGLLVAEIVGIVFGGVAAVCCLSLLLLLLLLVLCVVATLLAFSLLITLGAIGITILFFALIMAYHFIVGGMGEENIKGKNRKKIAHFGGEKEEDTKIIENSSSSSESDDSPTVSSTSTSSSSSSSSSTGSSTSSELDVPDQEVEESLSDGRNVNVQHFQVAQSEDMEEHDFFVQSSRQMKPVSGRVDDRNVSTESENSSSEEEVQQRKPKKKKKKKKRTKEKKSKKVFKMSSMEEARSEAKKLDGRVILNSRDNKYYIVKSSGGKVEVLGRVDV